MKLIRFFFTRLLLLIWITFSLISCDYIFQPNRDTKTEKITPIDFSSIDAYPLLKECTHLSSREAQQECFYQQVSQKIETALSQKNISINNSITDTIQVKIRVSSKGKISITSTSLEDTPELNTLRKAIFESIESLPTTQPAIKSGIPITSTYILPIIIRSTDAEVGENN